MRDAGTGTPRSEDPAQDAFAAGLARVLDPAGWALLESLPPYLEADALAVGARLRAQGHDPELVAAALTQARLRVQARDKFGEFAEQMLLTPQGLEQATRLPLAARHAQRFRAAGIGAIADLGCGIGGDAMAAAALGLDVLAVDRDPVTVAVATVNLRPFPEARAELGTVEGFDVAAARADGRGVWTDPARRTERGGGHRLHDPEQYSPPLSAVIDLARRLGRDGLDGPLGTKLGPGIAHEDLPAGTETQWLSWHGQVLEADCWFGPLATPGVTRSAVVIGRDGARALDDRSAVADPIPGPLGAHVYEPDGAVIRAGLLGRLAADLDAHTIDPTIAYLTTERALTTPFAHGYAVRDVLPFGLKRLTSYLREHHLGRLEIKKRGTAVEPEELRRRLRPRRFGDGEATLILTRIAGVQSVIVASPHRRP
ncbi:THUMP-like domain-containing protein [Brachybacterium sp. AOP25-B2-12]|uniref:THUMP-like domain-containing protein n=1 Tax=Brachybacterium sp. AOP25-B2-12 TaxID=3457710 RepID=UPI0040348744